MHLLNEFDRLLDVNLAVMLVRLVRINSDSVT